MSSGETNVDLSKTLEGAKTVEKETKKRNRKSALPMPPLPEGVRMYSTAVDVNPETQSLPPERLFTDPLFYWQSRVKYAQNNASFSSAKVAEMEAMKPEDRNAERKERMAKAAISRAVNNDLVKEEFAKNPALLVKGLSAEQVAALVAQLNALAAAQAVE